jgi:hypothetical protein
MSQTTAENKIKKIKSAIYAAAAAGNQTTIGDRHIEKKTEK